MPITQTDINQWLVEFPDCLTRSDGTSTRTVQIVADLSPRGVTLRPWRIVQTNDVTQEQIMIPLINTLAVWAAYKPAAALELFLAVISDSHPDYEERTVSASTDHHAAFGSLISKIKQRSKHQ